MARITKKEIEKAIAPFFVGSEYRIEFEESDQCSVFAVFKGSGILPHMEFVEEHVTPFNDLSLKAGMSVAFPDCPNSIADARFWIVNEFSLEKMSYEYLRKAALDYFENMAEEMNQTVENSSYFEQEFVLNIAIEKTHEAIGYCRDFIAEEAQ
jgi:hypothetical protein